MKEESGKAVNRLNGIYVVHDAKITLDGGRVVSAKSWWQSSRGKRLCGT